MTVEGKKASAMRSYIAFAQRHRFWGYSCGLVSYTCKAAPESWSLKDNKPLSSNANRLMMMYRNTWRVDVILGLSCWGIFIAEAQEKTILSFDPISSVSSYGYEPERGIIWFIAATQVGPDAELLHVFESGPPWALRFCEMLQLFKTLK